MSFFNLLHISKRQQMNFCPFRHNLLNTYGVRVHSAFIIDIQSLRDSCIKATPQESNIYNNYRYKFINAVGVECL